MNREFNANGGSIAKNKKWLLPQAHDMRRVRAVKYEDWRSFIINKLNRNEMVDDKGRILSDNNFEDALKYVYETISTGGLNLISSLPVSP